MFKKIAIALVILIVAAAAAIAGYGVYYYNKYVDIETIYPGVYIQGMDVGGMTLEEAQKKIDAYSEEVGRNTVTLQVGERECRFSLAEVGLHCTSPDTATKAYCMGRSGNIFDRILDVHKLESSKVDFPLTYAVDENQVRIGVTALSKQFLATKKNATIKRKKGKFIVTDEVVGIDIDADKNADKLIALLSAEDWVPQTVVFPMDYKEDKPEHTKAELSTIKDVLGTFTTSYAGSPEGRCANLQNGASLINGTVLYPGDEMSVYKTVSPFNKENGYHLAGSYENGSTIQTYGGGICQVSTTLYNAVLRAELKIVERKNHSMTVHYVELSEDAAIAGTEKDFKFKNTLDTPIYILGKTDGENIKFTIYGKEYRDKDRSIEFVSKTKAEIPPKVEEIKDDTLKKGKKVVEKQGKTGYKAELWKVIHQKGKEDEWVQINSSYYLSTTTVIRVGTKEEKKEKKENVTNDGTAAPGSNSSPDTSGSGSSPAASGGEGQESFSDDGPN